MLASHSKNNQKNSPNRLTWQRLLYPVISTSPLTADSDSVGPSIIIDTVGIGLSAAAGPLALLPLGVISVCPRATPFCPSAALSRVFCPFSVIGASCPTSRALFSLNCRYVVVLGITSARNSRLSIRETAVAVLPLATVELLFYTNRPEHDRIMHTEIFVLDGFPRFALRLDDVIPLLGYVLNKQFLER